MLFLKIFLCYTYEGSPINKLLSARSNFLSDVTFCTHCILKIIITSFVEFFLATPMKQYTYRKRSLSGKKGGPRDVSRELVRSGPAIGTRIIAAQRGKNSLQTIKLIFHLDRPDCIAFISRFNEEI